jgi:hypothetical protein
VVRDTRTRMTGSLELRMDGWLRRWHGGAADAPRGVDGIRGEERNRGEKGEGSDVRREGIGRAELGTADHLRGRCAVGRECGGSFGRMLFDPFVKRQVRGRPDSSVERPDSSGFRLRGRWTAQSTVY